MNTQLIVAAAGSGKRLGMDMPKALVDLCGRSIIERTIERLLPLNFSPPIIVLIPKGYDAAFADALESLPATIQYVVGGEERADSVAKGLDALDPETERVAIHDAARPFPLLSSVQTALEAAAAYGAATLAMPVADTIMIEDGEGCLLETPDRTYVWACQTPQVFRREVICGVYQDERDGSHPCTDDATLVQRAGHLVRLIDGGAMNFKITTKHELAFASYLLENDLL